MKRKEIKSMRNPLVLASIFFSVLTIGVCLEYQSSKNERIRDIAIISFPFAIISAFTAGFMEDNKIKSKDNGID